MRGTAFSMGVLHCTHFFMMAAQLAQATRCRHGLNSTPASSSEHTRHSSIWGREGGRGEGKNSDKIKGASHRVLCSSGEFPLHCPTSCASSSVGKSTGLETQLSQVRIPQGRSFLFLIFLFLFIYLFILFQSALNAYLAVASYIEFSQVQRSVS